ncbi:MAG: hypothetical protein ACI837_002949 [Crocinitomicaceae bacterium]|jgi:hypothetical protein
MSDYTEYHSPLLLLKNFGIDPLDFDESSLSLLRKRLLLELELSKNQTLKVNSSVYTKNDILVLFASFEKTSKLNFHLIIERTPFLQNILSARSSNDIQKEPIDLKFDSEVEEIGFINFISPYLAFAVNRLSRKLIEKKKYDQIIYLLGARHLIKNEDIYFAFKKLTRHYQDFVQFAEDIENKVITLVQIWKLSFFRNPLYFQAAGLLGSEVPGLADEICRAVINLSVKFENVRRYYYLIYPGLKNAYTIVEDPELRDALIHNIDFFGSKLGLTGGVSSQFKRILLIIGIIVFIFLAYLSNSQQADLDKRALNYGKTHLEHFDLQEFAAHIRDSSFHPTPDSLEVIKIHKYVSSRAKFFPRLKSTVNADLKNRFMNFEEIEEEIRLYNRTDRMALFIFKTPTKVKSRFILPNQSTKFKVADFSEILVYTGDKWDFHSPWCYRYPIPSRADSASVYFNGYFTIVDEKDENLATKVYGTLPILKHYYLRENSDSLWLTHKEN